MRVARGLDSVLMWRRSVTLCTSGFADGFVFSHNGVSCGDGTRQAYSRDFPDQQVLIVGCAPLAGEGAKSVTCERVDGRCGQ